MAICHILGWKVTASTVYTGDEICINYCNHGKEDCVTLNEVLILTQTQKIFLLNLTKLFSA